MESVSLRLGTLRERPGRRGKLQRLFPSFPHGWPGVGLLLLRAAVGLSLALQGVAGLAGGNRGAWTWTVGPLALATGAALLIGFLTPVTSGLAALTSLGVLLSLLPPAVLDLPGGAPGTIYLAVMAIAVLLLGPGAFSLDARFFGRREVVIPHISRPPSED
jgi:uncharacterized membrane protein YphA (DoxX/SURF4 family)